jgi:outer membrane lipoprotein-sorting protein
MLKNLVFFFCLTYIAADAIYASPADTTFRLIKDTASLNVRIRNYSKNLLTLQSDFVQMKYMSVLRDPSRSTGYFCFKNPGMVRWEYTDPFKYLVIINNNRLYMKDDKKNSSFDMSSGKAMVAMSSGLGKMLQGNIFDNKSDFSCSYYENDQAYKLALVPNIKTLKKYFSSITLYFDKKVFSVSRVVMFELNGDKTVIEFNDRKINEAVPDTKFSIK